MKDILEKYKNRLVNYSGRNQTLCRSKLAEKRAFDMARLSEFNDKKVKEILLSLIKDDDKEHLLLESEENVKVTLEEKKEIERNYKEHLNRVVIKENFSSIEIKQVKNDESEVVKERLIEILKKDLLKKKIEKRIKLKKNLDKLFNEIDTKERETGAYELYLGFPYIEGILNDGKTVRAPLFLFPSKIFIRDGEWYYKNLNKDKIYVNKVFLLAYKDLTGLNIDNIESEYEEVEEFFKDEDKIKNIQDFIEACKNWGKENRIDLNIENFNENVEIYKNFLKADYQSRYEIGELYLKNYFVLGQFSVGANMIFNDLDKIINIKDRSKTIETILDFDKEAVDIEEVEDNIIIDEDSSFFVSELDYSQEKAVKLAEKLNNLVVHGPPGTGKSQVIVNIISDYLAKGKRVLVVSEKRTALDVVYKRIESLNFSKWLAVAHDSKTSREEIVKKIESNYNEVQSKSSDKIMSVVRKSEYIENNLKKFEKLALELHKKRKIGASLYKLYTNSKKNLNLITEIADEFMEYNKFSYEELNTFLKL